MTHTRFPFQIKLPNPKDAAPGRRQQGGTEREHEGSGRVQCREDGQEEDANYRSPLPLLHLLLLVAVLHDGPGLHVHRLLGSL